MGGWGSWGHVISNSDIWDPCISGTAEAIDLKFCVHIERWGGGNENDATVGHMRVCVWVT